MPCRPVGREFGVIYGERGQVHDSPTLSGTFLTYPAGALDNAPNIDCVFCIGYRIRDDPDEAWTKFVNQVKQGERSAVERAGRALSEALRSVSLSRGPYAVCPILGSADQVANPRSAVSVIQQYLCSIELNDRDGGAHRFTDCFDLLSKSRPTRQLKSLQDHLARDSEIAGAFEATSLESHGASECGTVVMIDDIVTRGSTMSDAARAIRLMNPDVRVIGLALAKAESKQRWGDSLSNAHIEPNVLRYAIAP